MRPTVQRAALLGTGALVTTTILAAAPASDGADAPPSPAATPLLAGPAAPLGAADRSPAAAAAALPGTATVTGAARPPAKLRVTSVRRHVTAGRAILVKGLLRPRTAGARVSLQVRGRRGHWTTVDRDATSGRGAFRLAWTPADAGRRTLRVRYGGGAAVTPTRRTLGRANVYRPALASWYGPGLYGGHLACGGTLTPGTLGVAHKTLPCGTPVTLRYRGRTVRVPVVDRGPFVGAREFDLTSATRTRLGFAGTGTVLTTA